MAVVPIADHANPPLSSSTHVNNNKTFFSKFFGCGCFSSHQQHHQRTAASRPVTPVLTEEEQQRSEQKTSGRDLFCPICMYYVGQVLSMQCCGHSVCFVCASEYFSCHGLRFSLIDSSVAPAALACMHCAKPSFHALSIMQGGRVYEDSPSVMKMHLRQRNRLAMSGSGSITLPSPLKRGDGFDALAAKLVSYEQHANMLMTLPDTPASDSATLDNNSSIGRSSYPAVPTLQPAPSARASGTAKGQGEGQGQGLGGRSRPSSPLPSLSSTGSGAMSQTPSRLAPALRPVTPSSDEATSLVPSSPATSIASFSEADTAALAAAFVAAAGGIDDVRASASMVQPILADVQQQESADLFTADGRVVSEQGPTLNVPLQ